MRVEGSRREVAVKGDGHVFVAADAVLDGFGILCSMELSYDALSADAVA